VWSSELKGFLAHTDFKPVMTRQTVSEFLDFGYLLENRTWFEGIELVPPASILAFDMKKSKIEITHYWSWSDIKPMKEPIDERELAEELGRLFKQSVKRCVINSERIGISLSGGLDSRAILAAIPEDYHHPLHTFTFGQERCGDIRIADKVSMVKGAKHHVLLLNSDNWLLPRINGVWKSDASCSLLHMHGIEFCDEYKSHIDFCLDGLAGDLVLGGSYLRKHNLDKKIDSLMVKNVTHSKMTISNFNDWYMINKTDPYFINNRVRRFTYSGVDLFSKLIEVRTPFWHNELIGFVYSIPDLLRYNSYIYRKMLLNTFPEYYNGIPWQKTGCPISYSKGLVKIVGFKNRIVNKLKRESQRFGFKFKDLRNYTDYPSWIRQEPARPFFTNMLLNKNALYPQYVDRNRIHTYLKEHMEGKVNYHDELCITLTLELWLQQVFEGRYRN
jgi:asparagine synthase (glutamine-hydrolysing)